MAIGNVRCLDDKNAGRAWAQSTNTQQMKSMINKEYDLQESGAVVQRTCDHLMRKDLKDLADMNARFYDSLRQFLIAGRHISPVFHTPLVVETVVKIGLAEQIEKGQLRTLMCAAWHHDAGNDKEPAEAKITKAAVDADPSLRERAITQRLRHSRRSLEILKMQVAHANAPNISISSVEEIVVRHDNPTVAELIKDKEEKAKWLIQPGPESWLLWLHREADRLFMIHQLGVLTDGVRAIRRDDAWHPEAQLTKNVIRHFQERLLVESVFPACLENYGFSATTAFYRSHMGKELFIRCQENTRAVQPREWQALLEAAME